MHKIPSPILYSTMSLVAYNVNLRYYGHLHYLWCTPCFGPDYDSPHFAVPPSSSPLEIYRTFEAEIGGGDMHGEKIKLNRMGIRRGADRMLADKRISQEEHKEIVFISKKTPMHLFKPLLCVIPKIEALKYYRKVPINNRANPLSYEYIVADLPQSAFDIIRISK